MLDRLLARNKYDFIKSQHINHNIPKFCSISKCDNIPFVYPGGMLFPSIF